MEVLFLLFFEYRDQDFFFFFGGVDMAKRVGRVGFRSGQSGYGSNGSQVELGRVDPYFSKKFFFFFFK